MQFSRYMLAPLAYRSHSLWLAPGQLGICFADTSRDIRNGTFLLPDAEERKDGSVAFASCREPVFGRDNMEGF